jgi:hypothetical protein
VAGAADQRRGSTRECRDCLLKQVTLEDMAATEPLSPSEEVLWRAVMRIVKVIPRHLDSDLIKGAGLTASEYTTIMHLSEAPIRGRPTSAGTWEGSVQARTSNSTRLTSPTSSTAPKEHSRPWTRPRTGPSTGRTSGPP